MRHVVMFSGGIGSWATASRVADDHGTDSLTLLFADTLVEDADTYRFLHEAAEQVGGELVIVKDGRTPFEVFHDDHFLGNSRLANCSKYLKQKPCREWLEANVDPDVGEYTVHDWWDGAGKTIKRRKFASERQRKARDSTNLEPETHDSNADVTRDTQTSHGADSDSDSDRDINQDQETSRKRSDRATRLPEGWTPQPEPDLIRAIGGQKTADEQLAVFHDHWRAQPGAKGRKVDWQATWRNWLRRSREFTGSSTRPSPDPPSRSQPVVGSDEWRAREADQRAREDALLGGAA